MSAAVICNFKLILLFIAGTVILTPIRFIYLYNIRIYMLCGCVIYVCMQESSNQGHVNVFQCDMLGSIYVMLSSILVMLGSIYVMLREAGKECLVFIHRFAM